ncbi:MAG: serine/threonine protein kinase [Alteromonadaceae bacterium]|jgi:serine/threonine protein kinase
MSNTMDAFTTLNINNNPADGTNDWSAQLLQHFDIKSALGKGGQGSVFLAYEYRLQRDVAIKRIDHQPFNDTLLVEAQAQAKIEHPNISKLFQVIQSHSPQQASYLVMQYIQGQTALDWAAQQRKACHSKTQWRRYIEQIVTMTQQVCDGLQALHSTGIVHRDIKPANIMITTDHSNPIHPYIVDFGLAQHQENLSEFVSGSWPFMSPEQKRGDPLSASSDIYSLGVTLYQLLSAQLPQSADSTLTTKMDKNATISLPIELTVLIKRCLSPDRQHRYQSALELKQELQRFLTGEPITSIHSKSYQVRKKLIKYRWIVLFCAFVGLATIGQLSWLQQQKSQHQAREQLVQQFHQTVQQAQYQSNLAYMAPPHDIRYLQNQHQHNLEQITRQAQQLGATALPFALYAQGKIAQQQGDNLKAKQQLEAAWQQGFQTIESAYALVQVLNTLYQQALTRVFIMPHGALRQARQSQLQQSFVQPIISYLHFIQQQSDEQSSNSINQGHKSIIRALLHYYNQDYNLAIKQLNGTQPFAPWQYQHYLLLGQNYIAQYQQLRKPTSIQAQQLITKAELAFDQALAIAPSDPNNYLQKWQLYFTLVSSSQFGTGNALKSLNKAEQLLKDALKLNPTYLDSQVSQISTQFQRMVYLYNQGEPWQAALATSQSLVEQALMQWPQQPKLLREQAKILSRQLVHSQQPDLAQAQYQAIEQLYQQLAAQQQLGFDDLIYAAVHQKQWGDFIDETSTSREKYQTAATLFKQAIASKPQYSGSYVNLALTQLKLSETDTHQQGLARLNNAILQLTTALNKGYSEFIANYYLAKVRLRMNNSLGSTDLAKGVVELETALKAITQAKKAKPNNYHAIGLEIEVLSQLIENQWYLTKPHADLEQRLITLQLQRLSNNPHKLSALSHSSFILTLVLEKQLITAHINPQWRLQHQQITKQLNDKLNQQLADKPPSADLNPEQTLALSNLLYAQMLLAKTSKQLNQLQPLITRFSHTAKTADHYWTLANYHQLKAEHQTTPQQQLDTQATAIQLWQQAYQLKPNAMGYHYSLLKGYINQLVLFEKQQSTAKNQQVVDNTIEKVSALKQKLGNNTPLNQWLSTLLKQHQSDNLIDYLEANKAQNPFAASIMR